MLRKRRNAARKRPTIGGKYISDHGRRQSDQGEIEFTASPLRMECSTQLSIELTIGAP